jgi:hypothetical protein
MGEFMADPGMAGRKNVFFMSSGQMIGFLRIVY